MHQLSQVIQQALMLVLVVSGPPILLSLVIGFIVSVFQAATQIQEQTLSFVPKMIVVFGSLIVGGYWMISVIVRFTQSLFELLPRLGAM